MPQLTIEQSGQGTRSGKMNSMEPCFQLVPRRSPRIHVRMPVSFCAISGREGAECTVSTIDLSSHGVRISVNAWLVPGQQVVITADEGSTCRIPGRVVWVGPVGSRLEGHAGIEFLNPLPVPA